MMEQRWSYYLTQRPGGPGAQPSRGLIEMQDMGGVMDARLKHRVWSKVIYDRELTEQEIRDYELTPVPKPFHDLAKEMEHGSWYTITGAGDLEEFMIGYQDQMDAEGIGSVSRWEWFSGADMNREYGLTGDNRYQDDLTFLAFPLDGLDIPKLAMFKLQMGDRWFDDIVDNNEFRERHKEFA